MAASLRQTRGRQQAHFAKNLSARSRFEDFDTEETSSDLYSSSEYTTLSCSTDPSSISETQKSATNSDEMMKWKYPSHNSFIVDLNNPPVYENIPVRPPLQSEKKTDHSDVKSATKATNSQNEIYYPLKSPLNTNKAREGISDPKPNPAPKVWATQSQYRRFLGFTVFLAIFAFAIIVFILLAVMINNQEKIQKEQQFLREGHGSLLKAVLHVVGSSNGTSDSVP